MITQKRLREVLYYDKLTGVFTWLVSNSPRVKVGDVAGYLNKKGYWQIGVDGKNYKAHRLAWLYERGYLPENDIDHKDRVRHHNWISNLRGVSQQCNSRNTGNRSTNTSGVKGVYWRKRDVRWVAQICVNNNDIHLGYHTCLIEAACHRLAAEQAEDWEGCDSSSPAYQFVVKNINKGGEDGDYNG